MYKQRTLELLKLSLALAAGLWIATTLTPAEAQSGAKAKPAESKKQPTRGILEKEAPELTVNDWYQLPDGKEGVSIKDLKGKVVYAYFFQSWCPGCHKMGFPSIQAVLKKHARDEDLSFLAIQTTFEGKTVNTSAKALATAKKYDLKIPIGHSESPQGTPKIMKDFRSGGTPWVVIIDKKGIVRFNDFHIQPEAAEKLIAKLRAE